MEKVELTVSIEEPRLDVLNYYLEQDGSNAQKELERMLVEMYESKVPEVTRAYIDSKITPHKIKRQPRASPKPPVHKAVEDKKAVDAVPEQQRANIQQGTAQEQEHNQTH
ncbi:MAG: hypothetical protein IJQ98_09570 [Oscillospiraceae bacterium]|nr:hypothetical protein [Oscillospiraceae bacterium]